MLEHLNDGGSMHNFMLVLDCVTMLALVSHELHFFYSDYLKSYLLCRVALIELSINLPRYHLPRREVSPVTNHLESSMLPKLGGFSSHNILYLIINRE